MQCKQAQWMTWAMMVSAISVSAFAQSPTDGQLPPVALPVAPSTVTSGSMAPIAPMTPGSPPMAPAAMVPNVVVAPVAPEPMPSSALPTMPALTGQPQPTIDTILNNMGRPTPEPAPEVKNYSYGNSSLSILFMPAQIDQMKQAIRNYESTGRNATTFVAPVAAEPVSLTPTVPAQQVIAEPAAYPVFYLASIAYHTPKEWSLWVSGHKITSHKNDTDLTVLRVSRESVTFRWTPEYYLAIEQRNKQKQFASKDGVKYRATPGYQPIQLDETNKAVTFTLRQNQSFAVGYFSMFEGFMTTPAQLPPIGAITAATDAATPPPTITP